MSPRCTQRHCTLYVVCHLSTNARAVKRCLWLVRCCAAKQRACIPECRHMQALDGPGYHSSDWQQDSSDWQPPTSTGGSRSDTAAGLPEEEEAGVEHGAPPHSYLIAHSISKQHNLGMIARSATAFGVHEVCHARQAGAGAGVTRACCAVAVLQRLETTGGCPSMHSHMRGPPVRASLSSSLPS